MSDLEDYAYSPYDDLEDILWDADPNPELADDLAEHALHSPVYLDEIAGYELEEYHSDWEYYSDDYMDDDPTLENRDFVEKESLQKRGKKRKLVDTKDIPALDLNETKLILRSIKGTIWAKPRKMEPPTHNVGQGDCISLMKNWRQVFSINDDGWGRQTDATDNDESWAKDLGLADMGLQPQRQMSFEQGPVQEEEEEYDEEDSVIQGEEEDQDPEMDEDIEDPYFLPVTGSGDPVKAPSDINSSQTSGSRDDRETRTASGRTTRSGIVQVTNAASIGSPDGSDDEHPRKRRQVRQSLHSTSTHAGPESPRPTDRQQVNGTGGMKSARNNVYQASRKRKATEDEDDIASSDTRNVKRVAVGSGQAADDTNTTRSRRVRGNTKT
ncbi:hypothetical protein LTR84_002892 [Exophiala bonariae]|uniref:Uncharacterized protein n=1 Tax=Exophiala bonariae TaxID=1690606 RepID=A0AAV9NCN4_9EURO|nr:hypothetical protein LTR84_002892 [Exophiala bonariae]